MPEPWIMHLRYSKCGHSRTWATFSVTRVLQRTHGFGKLLPLQFFKCKFEKCLMVASTMSTHIKVAELNTLSDGKGITDIPSAVC